jgi:HNH endonuclease
VNQPPIEKRQLLEPCLNWTGYVNPSGYGKRPEHKLRSRNAHRDVYEKTFGSQGDLVIHHICENKRCINIEHLVAIARSRNMVLGPRYSRTKCRRGHDKTAPNGLTRDGKKCRICHNDSQYGRRQIKRNLI